MLARFTGSSVKSKSSALRFPVEAGTSLASCGGGPNFLGRPGPLFAFGSALAFGSDAAGDAFGAGGCSAAALGAAFGAGGDGSAAALGAAFGAGDGSAVWA